ncbi:MAG: hypothetical protein EXR70_21490 [Deltaproteobacteria bacterium]|nr:hypothetical protein [Deltaproteobacteria bacterium]
MKSRVGVTLVIVLLYCLVGEDVTLSTDLYISYVRRWMITEEPARTVKPPLTLLWEKSPIWFESWNAGGLFESPSRRIVETKDGFVTVIRKTVNLLSKEDGRTLWTMDLQGGDIVDWKVVGTFMLYSSVNYRTKERTRAALDLIERKDKWVQKDTVPALYQPDMLIPTGDGLAVFVSNGDSKDVNDAIVAIDINSGQIKWKVSTDIEQRTLVPFTWFTHGSRLHVLVTQKAGGLYLKTWNTIDGKHVATNHIFGTDQLGNVVHPSVITSDGILFIGYNKRPRPARLSLIAYDTESNKLLWNTDVTPENRDDSMSVKHVMHAGNTKMMVATMWPNRVVVFDSEKGSILKDIRLSGYVGWTDYNSGLYSYPYLITGARRQLASGMAFDLIALNLETGKVDWTYEIETQNNKFTFPTADTLNFIVNSDRVYVGRADAKIMSFRHAGGSK